MRRRDLLLFSALAVWPMRVMAQQTGTTRFIGLLGSDTAQSQADMVSAFFNRLNELGWSRDRNLKVAYRWAEGHTERLPDLARELVQLNVDLIITHNTPPTLAAKNATSTIPVVFATAGDAIGSGIVSSLARPGANVTGLSSLQPETAGKRIELLRELLPDLRTLAVLTDVGNPFAMSDVGQVRDAAHRLGIEVIVREIRTGEDIPGAFQNVQGKAQALYIPSVPLLFAHRGQINSLALEARLPTMHGVRELVDDGGLMSYGPNWPDMWRRAADIVDKILRGSSPADIPVEQPTKFDFVLNLGIARKLALSIPPTLLARADEVIE